MKSSSNFLMTFEFECIKILNFMNFQHENTDKIIQNHDFERKFFGVAHFFVILRVYPKMPKDGVYKNGSNPKSKRSIRIVIIHRVKLVGPVK